MAIVSLTKNGYGQVEPNHLAAQRTGQIYAQLGVGSTALATASNIIQNGMVMDYDYAGGSITSPAVGGSALTMLVMNEVRIYADFLTPKDYAMVASGTSNINIGLAPEAVTTTGGTTTTTTTVYPRMYKIQVGDIITTNLVCSDGTGSYADYSVGDQLIPHPHGGGTLYLSTSTTATVAFKVVSKNTTPDLQNALKLQCVKANA